MKNANKVDFTISNEKFADFTEWVKIQGYSFFGGAKSTIELWEEYKAKTGK